MAAEATVMNLARMAGVPAPPVLDTWEDRSGSLYFLVMPFVGGQPLTRLQGREAWRSAGRAVRLRHQLPLSALPEPDPIRFEQRIEQELDEELVWLSGRGLLDPASCRAAASIVGRALRTSPPERVVLDGDAQPDHFLFRFVMDKPAVCALVDFGDADAGDPLWDLAVLTLSQPMRWESVALGYGLDDDSCGEAFRRPPGYWLLRRLGEPRWLYGHGYRSRMDGRMDEGRTFCDFSPTLFEGRDTRTQSRMRPVALGEMNVGWEDGRWQVRRSGHPDFPAGGRRHKRAA